MLRERLGIGRQRCGDRGGRGPVSYTNFAYLFPRVSSCPWAGMADIGGTASYINAPALGDVGLYHAVHEFGHNLGAGHEHGLHCQTNGSAVALSTASACSIEDYGDPFSVMGSGIVHAPSAWELNRMGYVSADEVTVVAATDFGSYRLPVANADAAASRLFMVRRPSGGYLTLEYRQSVAGYDAYSATEPAVTGVMIRVVAGDSETDTALVDMTPQTSSFRDAPLAVGQRCATRPTGSTSPWFPRTRRGNG